ncbi:MAG: putative metal-binding motif-containing protein [Bacteroidetes bacterium]|nr:putative metal-binding motif-containing protein [Bacteroidota bacterium]
MENCFGGSSSYLGTNKFGLARYVAENCVSATYYADVDEDGYGDLSQDSIACNLPIGYVTDSSDCNDLNAEINPASIEICNDIDDNCNFDIDEGLIIYTLYVDADSDNFGDADLFINSCLELIAGYVSDSTDCDDLNILVNPSAIESCNSFDDNCNLIIDEDLTFYVLY